MYITFSQNKGMSRAIKNFKAIKSPTNYRLNLLFEINQSANCSLYYYTGKYGARYTLKDCQFTGDLSSDDHHIDGMKIGKNAKELVVKNCRFSSDFKCSFNINHNEKLFKFNLNEQIFKNDSGVVQKAHDKSHDSKINLFLIIAAIVMTVAAIWVFVIVSLILKKNENANEEPELSQEIEDPLL